MDSAEAWLRGATPHPRSGAVAERSYPTSKVRSSSCAFLSSHEETPHVQGKRNPSKMVGSERENQRADRLKPQHRQLAYLITWTAACLTQRNYAGPSKTDRSWWRVMTKRGALEKGMANHFSILALRTP